MHQSKLRQLLRRQLNVKKERDGGSNDSPLFVIKRGYSMEWTKEQRYQRINEVDEKELVNLSRRVNDCPWRQAFHVQPVTGLLNDPNGFSFYNGEYHLFYQWFPLGPVHGLKYWYHTKSKDLVYWENNGIAIEPGDDFDSHGAYSGSAIENNGKLHLIYTGNTRNEKWVRYPYQCMAVMDQDGVISKMAKPIISEVPDGYTDHYRDPKVWKSGDTFYAVLGAQRIDKTGCIVMYSSLNLIDWTFLGEMDTCLSDFGFMWECPDYFELQDKGVLIFSPQGLKPDGGNYQNIYQSGYVLGESLDLETRKLVHGQFLELDKGFDFYAPQTMQDPNGRRILVGWMGLPEMDYPTDKYGWAHCLTLPRELTSKGNKLLQNPVHELKALRYDKVDAETMICNDSISLDGFYGQTYELIAEFTDISAAEIGLELRVGDAEKTILKYDKINKKVILDRTSSGETFGTEFGTVRKCTLDSQHVKFQLFVDVSSVEVFVNDGEEVFTSRIFPNSESKGIRFFAKEGSVSLKAAKWSMKNTNEQF
jgi:beta-fructofuranosidase